MRKTVSIKKLIEQTNKFNATSADDYKAEREARNMFMESIMHDAGAYNGFGYLTASELSENATSVGIQSDATADGSWNFKDTDHTRICYYIDRKL